MQQPDHFKLSKIALKLRDEKWRVMHDKVEVNYSRKYSKNVIKERVRETVGKWIAMEAFDIFRYGSSIWMSLQNERKETKNTDTQTCIV